MPTTFYTGDLVRCRLPGSWLDGKATVVLAAPVADPYDPDDPDGERQDHAFVRVIDGHGGTSHAPLDSLELVRIVVEPVVVTGCPF